ncbi:MAG: hypothetical protein KBG28_32080, partial [Kofleriaceae bacterium]|nr:hypothetical protein [Kofleriaceae bacterium]
MKRHTRPARPRRRHATRLLALAMALTLVRALPTSAAPADIQASPAPTLGADPPKAEAIADGDANVSTQTGSFSYTYPITMPSGRGDMAPSLALSYSSQGAIYGGIAAGWSLSIPEIKWDPRCGIDNLNVVDIDENEPDDLDRDCFVSTLAGGRPLLLVTEPASADVLYSYRAQGDTSYARYQRLVPGPGGSPGGWRVLETSGVIHTFSGPTEKRMPLTSSIDAFGNEVEYVWSYLDDADGEGGNAYLLSHVLYTANKAHNVRAHAKVSFTWAPDTSCGDMRLGSATDFHYGERWVDGAHRLTRITAQAIDPTTSLGTVQHTRQIDLTYDSTTQSCTGSAAFSPFRQLASIQERAFGADIAVQPLVILPPVTFEYGTAALVRNTSMPMQFLGGVTIDSLSKGSRHVPIAGSWPIVEQMLLDFDGDGRQDLLRLNNTNNTGNPNYFETECTFSWHRNLGGSPLQFASASGPIVLPRLKWENGTYMRGGEGCSLSFMRTRFSNHSVPDCTHYLDGSPTGPSVEYPNLGTYLTYRWMDIDSDGQTDLVTAMHYDPSHVDPAGANSPFPQALPSCPGTDPTGDCWALPTSCVGGAYVCDEIGGTCANDVSTMETCIASAPRLGCDRAMASKEAWLPANPGYVELAETGSPASSCGSFTHQPHHACGEDYLWMVYRNTGGALSTTPVPMYQPVPLESSDGDSSFGASGGGFSSGYHIISDLDGDGALDAGVFGKRADVNGAYDPTDPSHWQMFRGDGAGGFVKLGGDHLGYVLNVIPGARPSSSEIGHSQHGQRKQYETAAEETLIDMNGDGLSDLVSNHWDTSGSTWGIAWGQPLGFVKNNPLSTPDTALPTLPPQRSFHLAPSGETWNFPTPGNEPRLPGHPPNPLAPPGASARQFDYQIHVGTRYTLSRTIDLDADGRPDLVRIEHPYTSTNDPTAAPTVHWNFGGQFHLLPKALSEATEPGITVAVQAVGTLTDPDNGGSVAGAWKTSGDLLDLDGDGLLEIVRYSGGAWQRHGHAVNGSPPRLLRRIRNGRGATTTVTYAAMTDSNIVTQTPAAKLHMPRAGWVVSSITEADSYEASAQTTDYRYHDPVYGPDAEVPADYGFRGFKKTRAILPAGQVGGQTGPRAVAVDEFSYDLALDPTGLKIRSTTYAGENQTVAAGNAGAPLTDANATSISETTYVKRGLFNNKVLTVVPHVSRSYTCYAGVDGQGVTLSQTQSQCLAAPASLTVSETGYVDKASSNAGGPNLLVEATSTMTQDGLVFDSNDRETLTTTYLLTDNAASPPVYRLRTIESVSTVGL